MKHQMIKIVLLHALLATAVATAACIQEETFSSDTPAHDAVEAELPAEYDITNEAALIGQPYDTDRQIWLDDTDGDGFPDATEMLDGSDPHDSSDFAGNSIEEAEAGFPTSSCRSGFRQAGPRLCISTDVQGARRYRQAAYACRGSKSRVCTYEDLTYLYYRSSLDASYDPYAKWIGNMVADDKVMSGNHHITYDNDPDIANFEGTSDKNDNRAFWCCHDDEL